MQIKRFEAKDMTSALRLIKTELGSDAVILSARNIKKENKLLGLVKSVGVEVTAAVDTLDLAIKTKSVAFSGAMNAYRQYGPSDNSGMRSLRRSAPKRTKSKNGGHKVLAGSKDNAGPAADSVARDLFAHLLSHDVNRDLAADIVAHLNQRFAQVRIKSTGQVVAEIANRLDEKCLANTERPTRQTGTRIVSIVGPSGVGKTTTIAKLAARHAIEQHQGVGLISLDAVRIGAGAELKVYAQAMGLPLKMAATPAACMAAVSEFSQCDLILVDTPGLNPRDPNEVDALKRCLDAMGSVETHLALSALTKERDLDDTIRRLNTLAIEGFIFTKLDESCALGSLINLLWNQPLPLSYVTDGRQVPEAIKTGSVREILQKLFGDFSWPTADLNTSQKDPFPEDAAAEFQGNPFVANRNSDVFHCSDCKWTRKIKPKNLITFSTAEDAQRQQFMPCRDCQPHKSQPVRVDDSMTGDSVRISSYS
jgi:flagellar biosynthesis protein FlhF